MVARIQLVEIEAFNRKWDFNRLDNREDAWLVLLTIVRGSYGNIITRDASSTAHT